MPARVIVPNRKCPRGSYTLVALAVASLIAGAVLKAGLARTKMAGAPAATSEAQPAAEETSEHQAIAPVDPPIVTPLEPGFFDDYKFERERARSREIETIEMLASNPGADAGVRKRASEALLATADRARREFEAESMIRAKGYLDAVVSLSDAGACVVVKSGRLEEAGATQIGDAVSRATGVELRKITIVECAR
ncbi:MAG: SpoIIIAH-like family protein [Clostridia bacterium]|nr:SpoIIIAH-like family protein [Clostridia bacterium]